MQERDYYLARPERLPRPMPDWWHQGQEAWAEFDRNWARQARQCAAGKCKEDVAYVISYRYITGRLGRVTTSERKACAAHAAAFAKKHGLELPDSAPVVESLPPVHPSLTELLGGQS